MDSHKALAALGIVITVIVGEAFWEAIDEQARREQSLVCWRESANGLQALDEKYVPHLDELWHKLEDISVPQEREPTQVQLEQMIASYQALVETAMTVGRLEGAFTTEAAHLEAARDRCLAEVPGAPLKLEAPHILRNTVFRERE